MKIYSVESAHFNLEDGDEVVLLSEHKEIVSQINAENAEDRERTVLLYSKQRAELEMAKGETKRLKAKIDEWANCAKEYADENATLRAQLELCKEQRNKYAYRWSHNGDEFREIVKTNDLELSQIESSNKPFNDGDL